MSNQEFICIAPSANGYVWIYTTDFNVVYREKYRIKRNKGYLEFFSTSTNKGSKKFPIKLKDISNIDAKHFYERDITEYINPKYIDLGLDGNFIKEYLQQKFSQKKLNYDIFILDLKYSYIGGHVLNTYWDVKYEEYINFKIYPFISSQQKVVDFLKKNKNKVDALVFNKCNYALSGVNLSLNYYKLTNITVTHDGVILYQFSFKLK